MTDLNQTALAAAWDAWTENLLRPGDVSGDVPLPAAIRAYLDALPSGRKQLTAWMTGDPDDTAIAAVRKVFPQANDIDAGAVVIEVARALIALSLPASGGEGWQPMDSAPKDAPHLPSRSRGRVMVEHDRQILERALGILHLMAVERVGWRQVIFGRWYYPDEPLRNDAANLLRSIGYKAMLPYHTRHVGDE